MIAVPPPTILLHRPGSRPVHSYRQVYLIGAEPYVFIAERWREGEQPVGIPTLPSLIPGHVMTHRLIQSRTGEVIQASSSSWAEDSGEAAGG